MERTRTLMFDEHGHGDPLLLVHGFPLNREMWAGQVPALAPGRRLIMPDLRGFGATPPAAEPAALTLDAMAAEVRDLLDVLSIQRAVICGLSMGGYVALAFARRFPERVQVLILADTSARPDTGERRASRTEQIELAERAGTAALIPLLVPLLLAPRTAAEVPALERLYAGMVVGTSVAGLVGGLIAIRDRADSRPFLAAMTMPSLVIVGEQDAITPPELSEEIAAGMPNATLVTLPGAGHMANVDAPDRFNAAVLDFLRNLSTDVSH